MKTGVNFSIDINVLKEFRENTKRLGINMSGLIQNAMESYSEKIRDDMTLSISTGRTKRRDDE